jgi:hypothetical protein
MRLALGWRSWCVAALASVLAVLVTLAVMKTVAPAHATFQLELSVTHPGIVQLNFDTGHGFAVHRPIWRRVTLVNQFAHYQFDLPFGTFHAFHLTPLNGAGPFHLKDLRVLDERENLLHQFAPNELTPLSQISELRTLPDDILLATPDGIKAPQLLLSLPAPLKISALHTNLRIAFIAVASATAAFLITLWLIVFLTRVRALDRLHALVAFLQKTLSLDGCLQFDRLAIGYFFTVTLVCAALALMGIHGSSISILGNIFGQGPSPLAGKAKTVRSDEYNYQTPAIIYQAERPDTLNATDSILGPGDTSLLGNMPARHILMLFRPQFWGFFILPVHPAFAFYWQMKTWLLLIGLFLVFRLFTESSEVALFGALWFYFSSFTQWWFSTPAAMPEMIGSFGFTVVGACYLLVGRHRIKLAVVALLTALFALNFALCVYPPYQIPLGWCGLALLLAFAVAHRKDLADPSARMIRITAIGGCAALIALALLKFYIDARIPIHIMSDTIYPGRRRTTTGGGVTFPQLLSHFMSVTESETSFPSPLLNICEASGFYWFAPVVLLLLLVKVSKRTPISPTLRASFIAQTIVFSLLLAWITLPVPGKFGRLFFLDRTGGGRVLLALGLINILMTLQFLAIQAPAPRLRKRTLLPHTALFIGLLAIVTLLLLFTNRALANAFSTLSLVAMILLTTAMLFCLVTARKRLFAALVLIPLTCANGLVNPLQIGFPGIDHSELRQVTDRLPPGKWAVFGESGQTSAFFSANGLDVFDGCKYVPPMDFFRTLDPSGRYENIYNRSAFLVLMPIAPGVEPSFDTKFFQTQCNINPLDPRLLDQGIRYFAFFQKAPDPGVIPPGALKLLEPGTVDGFWLYELAPAAPPSPETRNAP